MPAGPYPVKTSKIFDGLATVRGGKLAAPPPAPGDPRRSILKGGRVIDPANGVDAVLDIAFAGGRIVEVGPEIRPEKGETSYRAGGLQVWPGLMDMHLHLGDLFEVSTQPISGAVADGVTLGLSPGAGNTFMAPALLGAEVDRGVPLNIGVYLGAQNVMGTLLSDTELVALFAGELDEETALAKMTRSPITYRTAPLIVGLKDHMGHWIASDEHLDRTFEVAARAGLVFMSHTQDPAHSERVAALSKGRPVHLGHANAAGCGTHAGALEGMERVLELLKMPNVSAEFVTAMLRRGGGNREGLIMPPAARQAAYEALSSGLVNILVSDGQGDATMKGFGDTRDNIPCILELAEMGVLSLSQAVAGMTANPAGLFARVTRQEWWAKELGHLGVGARANLTVVDPEDKLATYTFVNGILAGFENRTVRRANGAGAWVCKFGLVQHLGVGDLPVSIHN